MTAPQTLVSAFAAQVPRQGARPAVTDGVQVLSYAELAERSDRLAHTLRAGAGVERGSVVGIAAGRSADLIVALLAASKSGAAYLPLDPGYPSERLRFMVADSGAAAVLVQPDLADRLARFVAAPLIATDAGAESAGASPAPLPEPTPDDAAYVIYTSGTTGDPKGVVVEHRNVMGLFEASRHFGFGADDVWSQFHSVSFDFSVWEIWGALLHGGRLAIVPPPVADDPELFAGFLAQEGVTVLSQTPSAFRGLADTNVPLPSVRLVVFGGEPVDLHAVGHWLSTRGEAARLVNMYGITETTVHVTQLPLTRELCSTWQGPGSPIGQPLPGAVIRLVDPQTGEPSKPGETGEIRVGGFGVARGYLNRPELTAERFVVETGARMYRSGDLGRAGPDGGLAHLGRMDDQVKVRGFRIELPEVESALDRLPGVAKSAVTVQGSGAAATLAAFVVPQREQAPAVLELLSRSSGNGHDGAGRIRFTELPNGVEVAHANPGETRFLYDEVYVHHAYGRHGITIPDKACVLDVGANIGMFSLWASEQASDVAVVAFEPLPPTFALLRTNLALHGAHARALPYGIGARDEEATFFYFPYDTIFSGRYPGNEERSIVGELLRRESREPTSESIDELLDDRLRTVAYRCRIKRLSDVIADLGIDHVDLLKIDVEKAELEVFEGIADRDWPLIDQIAIEAHGEETARRLVPELERRGFSVVAEEDASLRGVGLTNVYARRSRRSPPRHTPQLPRFRGRRTMAHSLRDGLREVLPPYAVPSRIELVPALPLTANGKIDRAALAVPDDQPVRDETAELTPAERVVASVFESVLGRPVLSPDDNFFELGGQSLIGIEAVRRLRVAFGRHLPIALLFQHPRVSSLAAAIGEHAGDSPTAPVAAAPPEPRRPADGAGHAPLTEAELPLWAFQDLFRESSALNVARDVVVGRPYGEDLVEALRESLGRHPSLRTCFVEHGDEIRKLARDVCVAPCRIPDFSDEVCETLAPREANRPFELATQVPIRVFVGARSPDSTRMLFVMHHIATDGTSMRALIRECVAAVAGDTAGVDAPAASGGGGRLARADSDAYWGERLAGLAPLPLPAGRARVPWPSLAAGSTERLLPAFDLDPITVDGTIVTPQAYLLSCFAASLRSVLGAHDVAIGIPHSERDGAGEDELGCFVTMAPIRVPSTAADALAGIHRQLLEVIDRGSPSAAAERRARIAGVPPGHHPLFQVTFSYHEQPLAETFSVGGVDASVRELRPAELQFDLSLAVAPEGPSGWRARLEFRTSSFSRDVADELLDAFVGATATGAGRA